MEKFYLRHRNISVTVLTFYSGSQYFEHKICDGRSIVNGTVTSFFVGRSSYLIAMGFCYSTFV